MSSVDETSKGYVSASCEQTKNLILHFREQLTRTGQTEEPTTFYFLITQLKFYTQTHNQRTKN